MEEGGRTYFANTRLAPDQASGSNPKGKSAKKKPPKRANPDEAFRGSLSWLCCCRATGGG